ncbi:ABC transporter permease [Dyella nitratireducens]|uniref:ABC transporter permease n=1 Tax=Dyella nitratireducens TaxID=1849580 RepID=A0ABQ1FLH4_9GAMM|nr:ABC transporter permease [Dyella nitratireducens]GGA19721.1 ABC transporter permease [Dyella nitratireducens]GLQ44472.1 ABC transporter permease [Dyella nitratireducens]
MTLHPILAALRRHKVAALLIVLQIALTLAIVSNAVFIIGHHVQRMMRPTGMVEEGLIRIVQQWPAAPSGDDDAAIEKLDALQRADLETLRSLPDVQEVAASTSNPLLSGYIDGYVSLDADQKGQSVHVAYYYGDQNLRSTFGLHLIAGRDFSADEIRHGRAAPGSPVIIVSKPVADRLFPNGNALGQTVYQDGKPATIVGIVERLQNPRWMDSDWVYNSVIEPLRQDDAWTGYMVRARPGRTDEAMREIRKALFATNPMRLMPEPYAGIHTFAELRARAYRSDRGIALLMGLICLILLSVTAAGIVGLTSFWVVQRHRQIGVRRALGARRIDILRYFQLENLLIAGSGAIIGVLLAFELNHWLMTHYEMTRLPPHYVAIGTVAILVLAQASVLVPARRASNVPPVVATRSV